MNSEEVTKVVREVMLQMGFDLNNPIEVQKDIQHLRKSRAICDLIIKRAIITGVVVTFTGVGAVSWYAFTHFVGK